MHLCPTCCCLPGMTSKTNLPASSGFVAISLIVLPGRYRQPWNIQSQVFKISSDFITYELTLSWRTDRIMTRLERAIGGEEREKLALNGPFRLFGPLSNEVLATWEQTGCPERNRQGPDRRTSWEGTPTNLGLLFPEPDFLATADTWSLWKQCRAWVDHTSCWAPRVGTEDWTTASIRGDGVILFAKCLEYIIHLVFPATLQAKYHSAHL